MPRLGFAEYHLIEENIVHFITGEGAKLDIEQANTCLDVYRQLDRPLGILIDRSNAYSSSLEFIMMIAELKQIKALAVYVPNQRSAKVADSQKLFFPIPFQYFYEKDEAINWIKQHLD